MKRIASVRLPCDHVCEVASQVLVDVGGPSSLGQCHSWTGGSGLYENGSRVIPRENASSQISSMPSASNSYPEFPTQLPSVTDCNL